VFGPIGQERDDYLAAMLAQRITSMLSSSGKAPEVKGFMPKWDGEEVKERG
jgi:hypothetical protein